DAYTYAHIELEDSAAKVNAKLNEILQNVAARINQLRGLQRMNDTDIEFHFSQFYFEEMFSDDLAADVFSDFEICIDSNRCENWPEFERVYVYPEESIYYEADYSKITKKYIASTINLC